MCSPKIEPEIVFKLKTPIGPGPLEAAAVLESVEWLALGFEIIDCVFPDWKFQPVDFVASFGLHAGLVVGEPLRVDANTIPQLVEQLPRFTVKLLKNGELVRRIRAQLSSKPGALPRRTRAAILRRSPEEPLAAGELISSGTLTESQPIAPGETWTAVVEGLDLPALTLTTT